MTVHPTAVSAHTDPGGPPTPSSPQTQSSVASSKFQRSYIQQDATWLAAKKAYRVLSGIDPTKPRKGQVAHPSVLPVGASLISPLSCPQVAGSLSAQTLCGGGIPTAKTLTLDQYASATWEPSNGTQPNYGAGTSSTDDAAHVYGTYNANPALRDNYANRDFYLLCGPGASDIVLDFWPAPPNLMVNSSADDPAYSNYQNRTNNVTTTYWNGYRMRGYMTYLAWKTQAPDWPTPGMMDTSTYHSNGVTEYDVLEALNWEASGKNVNGWHNYFYAIRWHDDPGVNQATLNSDVTSDIGGGSVPVQAEVDLQYLPNGLGNGSIYHQIAIIGYNNNVSNPTYTYVDTCASTTGCNGVGGNSPDSRVFTVSQSQM